MKIHYISLHSVLEYDEVKLFTELGFEVHSNGAYRDPAGSYTLPRPGIPGMKFDQTFFDLSAIHPKTNLPPEMIEPYDVIVIMAGLNEQVLTCNWERIKHKRVIWRSIGQNTPTTEKMLQKYRGDGLEIVRYSPKEFNYPNFAGSDALIRFYKDESEFGGWIGDEKKVVNFSQSLRGRGAFLHYDEVMGAMAGFNSMVYGNGNSDLGVFNGGEIPYEMMKERMKHCRVYVYGGTWPACYTLSLIEAMMTGIPVVAIGKGLAHSPQYEKFDFYEVDEIIQSGVNGFVGNSVSELRQHINSLLGDDDLAESISAKSRKTAIEYFGKQKIGEQWKDLLIKTKNVN